jgi:HD-like signal output (HDOD) protein
MTNESPRITIRDSADADVIRTALAWYLDTRKRQYHRAAATADTAQSLRLSLDYESDKEYVCGLLRAVGDGMMVPQAPSGTESKDNDNE